MASRKMHLRDNVEPLDVGEVEWQFRPKIPHGVEDQAYLTHKKPWPWLSTIWTESTESLTV